MSIEEFEDFLCPYCGESNQLVVDLSGGSHPEFVVDCEVCCAPIMVRLEARGGEILSVDVRRENEYEIASSLENAPRNDTNDTTSKK